MTPKIIVVISLALAFIKSREIYNYYDDENDKRRPRKNSPFSHRFMDFWTMFFNFFLAGFIGYYFINIRWPILLEGKPLIFSDLALFLLFTVAIFGHLPYLSKNITKGITAIIAKVLE